jgi:hypothetical protein
MNMVRHNKYYQILGKPDIISKGRLSSYTSYNGLIIRTYRELKKLNSPKLNDPMKK